MQKPLDLVGKRFGKLAVIGTDNPDKWGNSRFICRCDCGNTKTILGFNLTNGITTACGCIKSPDISGNKYGRLLVLCRHTFSNSGEVMWKCLCDCGNIIDIRGYSLKNGKTKSCGCLRIECSVFSRNPDLTDEERKTKRACVENDKWRNSIHKRDKFTCMVCGKMGGYLHVHHIYNYADYKNLRLDIDNGITMCKKCHREFHRIYGDRNTSRQQFNEYASGEILWSN